MGPNSGTITNSIRLLDTRDQIQSSKKINDHAPLDNFLELLVRFQNRGSELERDNVFSLLGIARHNCGLEPDYSVPAGKRARDRAGLLTGNEETARSDPEKETEIYQWCAMQIIKSTRNVNTLGALKRFDSEGQDALAAAGLRP